MGATERSDEASPLGQVGRSFATLGIAEIGARLIAFLATAWVSQALGASQFGVVSFALAAMLYAHRVVAWELEATGIVEVAERGEAAARAAGTILVARLACALGALALVTLLARWVLPSPDDSVLILYTMGLTFVALNPRFVYLMRHEPVRPAIARLLTEGVSAAIVVGAVHTAADVQHVPLGFIVGEGIAAAFLLGGVEVWRGVRDFDLAYAREAARRVSPLVLSALLGLLVFNLDLILLRFTWGSETAGYYAAAYALVSLLLNLGVTYYANVLPALSRVRADRAAFQSLFADASAFAFTLVVPCVVGGAVLSAPLVALVFGPEYAAAASPLPLLLVAAGLTVSRFVPLASVVALGRRREALWINGSGALVNVGLNLVFIPRLGLLGAAWAAAITDMVRLLVALALSHRAGVGHQYSVRYLKPAAAAAAMGAVAWTLRGQPVLLAVLAGGLTYAVALGALGVLRAGPGLRVRLTP